MLQNECLEAAEAYVSPSAEAKSETPLWNVYIQISSTSHFTSHSQCPFQSYTFTEQLMGSELFSWGVYLTCRKKKKTTTEAQCGPLVTGSASADALQWFSSHSLLPSAVLSLYSYTVWVFTVKSTADLRKDTAHWSCLQREQSSIWRSRWFSKLVSLMSQWAKNVCVYRFNTLSPNYDFVFLSSSVDSMVPNSQGQVTESHCDYPPSKE